MWWLKKRKSSQENVAGLPLSGKAQEAQVRGGELQLRASGVSAPMRDLLHGDDWAHARVLLTNRALARRAMELVGLTGGIVREKRMPECVPHKQLRRYPNA